MVRNKLGAILPSPLIHNMFLKNYLYIWIVAMLLQIEYLTVYADLKEET